MFSPFHQGYDARNQGVHLACNPHSPHSEDYQQWVRGWYAAHEDWFI